MGTTIGKKKNYHIKRRSRYIVESSSNNRSHGSMHTQLHQFYKHLKFMLINPFSILHIKCFIIIIKTVVSKLKRVTCNPIIQRSASTKSKLGIRSNTNMSYSAEDCTYYNQYNNEWQMNEIIKRLVGSLQLLQKQHQQQQIQGICIIRLISLKIIFKQQHPEQIPEYTARPLEEDHHLQKQRKQLNVEQIQIFVRTLLRVLNEKQWLPLWQPHNHACYHQQKEQQQQQQTYFCKRYFGYYRVANKIWQLQHGVKQRLSHYHPKLTDKPDKWTRILFITWRCYLYAFPSVSSQTFKFVQYFCIIVYIANSNNSNNHIHIIRAINSKCYCCCIYPKKILTSKIRNIITKSVLVMLVDVVANGIIKYIQETKVQSFAVKKFQLQPLISYGYKNLYKNYNTNKSNRNRYIGRDNHSTTIVRELKEIVNNRITRLTASSSAASLSLSAAATPAASQLVQYNYCSRVQQQQNNSLPSWGSHLSLLLPRIFVFLLILSSLCHGIECFHGSVKLSTNTVKTKYGLLRGTVVRTSPLVEAYLGIPYASPPVGNLRYMPPITPSSWKSLRNADRFSAVCPQTVPIPPNGPEALLEVPRARLAQLRRLLPLLSNQSEDCLYLNLYVPYEKSRYKRYSSTSREAEGSYKLPAILFIHGESYEWNSGNPYDGSELAAHGSVIVVTINFRLGIFGFLKTGGKESAQGNFGLMDLVAGLHWLKENLPAFGGDPQSITLLGHGTGAALANILVVSPVANDLIQRTVLVSGSALTPWAIQKNPLFVKRRVAEQTGCHGDMLYDDLAPCLRTKSVAELLAVEIDHPRFLVGFAPFIDGTVISPPPNSIGKSTLPLGSAIVSTSGIEYANFPKRNLIFCLTSVESHLDLNAQDLEFGFNETRRDRILRTFVRNNFHYHLNEIFAVVKNEYTDWEKTIRSPLSSRDATLAFLSDGHTASSLIKLGYMHNLRGGKSYFLHFKHRTVEEEYPQRTGSVRGEDVPFWLGLPLSPLFPHNYTLQEKQISHLMLRYLVNFARTGNPNQSSMRTLQPARSTLNNMSPHIVNSTSNEYKVTKIKRSSNLKLSNVKGMINKLPNVTQEKSAKAAAREALNLAIIYNKRRTKRTHSHHNLDNSADSAKFELSSSDSTNTPEVKDCPFWDAYDVVNQLYLELGSKAEIQSHYRGHKLSMWLNLIPQLHRHTNMNDLSMRHHQFQDDINHMNLYEGIVRPQPHIKPEDNENDLLVGKVRTTTQPFKAMKEANDSLRSNTECSIDGGNFINADLTTPQILADNESLQDPREKDLATASTALIGNLDVLRRLNSKEFQSYTTALIATVSVGCFLLILNVLIFTGIYHQREKRARDAKTKEELQDNDASKNSSMLKLNTIGSESGSFSEGVAGFSGKSSVLFGEYTCYDEKSLPSKDEKLLVDIPSSPTEQLMDPATWGVCNSSTLDLLKAKHHHTGLNNTSSTRTYNMDSHMKMLPPDRKLSINSREKVSCSIPLDSAVITSSAINIMLHNKGAAFKGSATQTNQYDFASVQSSDQMSFQFIEDAVKSAHSITDITLDDDIPEPPPPPKSFQSIGTGGILRQAGANSATPSGGKKRVHIQEISV